MYLKFICVCWVTVCVVAAPPTDEVPEERQHPTVIPILSLSAEYEADGKFKYSYETGNGIKREETAYDKEAPEGKDHSHHDCSNEGGEDDDSGEIHVQKGSYSYTAPDGTLVSVSYIADENGFQPINEHIQYGHHKTSEKAPEKFVQASNAEASASVAKENDSKQGKNLQHSSENKEAQPEKKIKKAPKFGDKLANTSEIQMNESKQPITEDMASNYKNHSTAETIKKSANKEKEDKEGENLTKGTMKLSGKETTNDTKSVDETPIDKSKKKKEENSAKREEGSTNEGPKETQNVNKDEKKFSDIEIKSNTKPVGKTMPKEKENKKTQNIAKNEDNSKNTDTNPKVPGTGTRKSANETSHLEKQPTEGVDDKNKEKEGLVKSDNTNQNAKEPSKLEENQEKSITGKLNSTENLNMKNQPTNHTKEKTIDNESSKENQKPNKEDENVPKNEETLLKGATQMPMESKNKKQQPAEEQKENHLVKGIKEPIASEVKPAEENLKPKKNETNHTSAKEGNASKNEMKTENNPMEATKPPMDINNTNNNKSMEKKQVPNKEEKIKKGTAPEQGINHENEKQSHSNNAELETGTKPFVDNKKQNTEETQNGHKKEKVTPLTNTTSLSKVKEPEVREKHLPIESKAPTKNEQELKAAENTILNKTKSNNENISNQSPLKEGEKMQALANLGPEKETASKVNEKNNTNLEPTSKSNPLANKTNDLEKNHKPKSKQVEKDAMLPESPDKSKKKEENVPQKENELSKEGKKSDRKEENPKEQNKILDKESETSPKKQDNKEDEKGVLVKHSPNTDKNLNIPKSENKDSEEQKIKKIPGNEKLNTIKEIKQPKNSTAGTEQPKNNKEEEVMTNKNIETPKEPVENNSSKSILKEVQKPVKEAEKHEKVAEHAAKQAIQSASVAENAADTAQNAAVKAEEFAKAAKEPGNRSSAIAAAKEHAKLAGEAAKEAIRAAEMAESAAEDAKKAAKAAEKVVLSVQTSSDAGNSEKLVQKLDNVVQDAKKSANNAVNAAKDAQKQVIQTEEPSKEDKNMPTEKQNQGSDPNAQMHNENEDNTKQA